MDTKSAWDMEDAIVLLQESKIEFLYLQPVWVKFLTDLQKAEDMFNTKFRVPCWAIICDHSPIIYLRMDNAEFINDRRINRVNIILPEQGILEEIKNGLTFKVLKEEEAGKYYWDRVSYEHINGRFWESIVAPRPA